MSWRLAVSGEDSGVVFYGMLDAYAIWYRQLTYNLQQYNRLFRFPVSSFILDGHPISPDAGASEHLSIISAVRLCCDKSVNWRIICFGASGGIRCLCCMHAVYLGMQKIERVLS